MKKGVASVLVVLVLMNVMGYYGLLVGLQYRNAEALRQKIAAGTFASDETTSLKIPMPGHSVSEAYEYVDAEFVKDGQVFRLVKQRLYRDTFHIVFIRDEMGTLIKHALADYAQSFASHAPDSDDHLIILPILIREYVKYGGSLSNNMHPVITSVPLNPARKYFFPSYQASIIHPPERASLNT